MSSNPYLYAMHDPGGEDAFLKTKGWIVFTEELGHDPTHMGGRDYRPWSDQGFGIIARLNNGYGDAGTIPEPQHYAAFAQRCANFVAASPGCSRFVIGNEPNHSQERPNGQPISADSYADCYAACRSAIHSVPGHEGDEVIVAAIAPWNVETGDWLTYFDEVLFRANWYGDVDAIALHGYTHGHDPALITSEATMDPPYQDRRYHFRAYQDFLDRVPAQLQSVPVYITETDQDNPWVDVNSGWVQAAYAEIDRWNMAGGQMIRCLALYRWPKYDRWYIEGKGQVIQDFKDAQRFGYTWTEPPDPPDPPEPPNGGTMIIRDSFESGFYRWEGVGEVTVPNGWTPDWVEGPDQKRPEYKPDATPIHVFDGSVSAKMTHRHVKFDGILYRTVEDILPGSRVDIECYFQAYSAPEKGGLAGRIGIDPTGGTDFRAGVIWGDWWGQYQDDWTNFTWHKLVASVEAQSQRVTVFLEARVDWGVNVTAAHFDAFMLVAQGDQPPPPNGDVDYDRIAKIVQDALYDRDRRIAASIP